MNDKLETHFELSNGKRRIIIPKNFIFAINILTAVIGLGIFFYLFPDYVKSINESLINDFIKNFLIISPAIVLFLLIFILAIYFLVIIILIIKGKIKHSGL